MSIGEHRHCLRNIQNIRICIGKKPIVSVRISKALNTMYDFKNILRKQKRVTKLQGLKLKFKNYCTTIFFTATSEAQN